MKKCIALAVVMTLLCSCALAETLDISGKESTLNMNQSRAIQVELTDDAAFAAKNMDAVEREGDIYSVHAGNVTYHLDVGPFPTFLCFTQDLYASFDAYLRHGSPKELQKMLIDEDIHFFLYDLETELTIYIYSDEADELSALAEDFSSLSPANQELIASILCTDPVLKQAGNTTWILGNDHLMATIVGGEYVIVEFGGSDDPAADLEDTLALLSHLQFE